MISARVLCFPQQALSYPMVSLVPASLRLYGDVPASGTAHLRVLPLNLPRQALPTTGYNLSIDVLHLGARFSPFRTPIIAVTSYTLNVSYDCLLLEISPTTVSFALPSDTYVTYAKYAPATLVACCALSHVLFVWQCDIENGRMGCDEYRSVDVLMCTSGGSGKLHCGN